MSKKNDGEGEASCTLLLDAQPYQMFALMLPPYMQPSLPCVWVVEDANPCPYHLLDLGGFRQWQYLSRPEEIVQKFDDTNAPERMISYVLSSRFRSPERGVLLLHLDVNYVYQDCTAFGLMFEPTEFLLEFRAKNESFS